MCGRATRIFGPRQKRGESYAGISRSDFTYESVKGPTDTISYAYDYEGGTS
jgi:hypothetical protein